MTTATTARCPICDAPAAPPFAPFCGPGCKDRDLLRWFGEGYRIPAPFSDTESLDSRFDTD